MPPDSRVVVGVGAVVKRGNEYLMLQRGTASFGYCDSIGQWAFPGGWVERLESAQDTAVRECLEETGLFVIPRREDGFVMTNSPSGITIVTLYVECDYTKGEPVNREPDKAMAVRWVPQETLGDLNLFDPVDQWWRRSR